ncbi:MAG: glycosyltransferase, partial [Bacteroidales bacterium]|nr:glycosyltransferase [Bacteroidales bacterium]
MDISVIIPLYNEAESLDELTGWIVRVMDEHRFSFEIILVDDGSTDGSWETVERLHAADARIRGIKFRR